MCPSWNMQMLSEAFPDAMDNKGVIPSDNVKWLALYKWLK
jgi:hypothetical protein